MAGAEVHLVTKEEYTSTGSVALGERLAEQLRLQVVFRCLRVDFTCGSGSFCLRCNCGSPAWSCLPLTSVCCRVRAQRRAPLRAAHMCDLAC